MVFGRISFAFLVVATLVGCAARGRQPSMSAELSLAERSASVRPGWLNSPPGEEGESYLFVGRSGSRTTEEEAREEALLVARRRFVEFAGVEVALLDEVEHTSAGKASSVLDGEVSILSRVSQSMTATIRRFRARQWYWERYQEQGPRRGNRSVYRCWVLASVPKDELHRIQARQEQQQLLRKGSFEQRPSQDEVALRVTVGPVQREVFREGGHLFLNVSAERDCYLLLIYQDAAGSLLQVQPSKHMGVRFLRAGQVFSLPGRDDGFTLTIAAPFGREYLWAFAASRPFPSLPGQVRADGTVLLHGKGTQVFEKVRAHGAHPGMGYGEARAVVLTSPQT